MNPNKHGKNQCKEANNFSNANMTLHAFLLLFMQIIPNGSISGLYKSTHHFFEIQLEGGKISLCFPLLRSLKLRWMHGATNDFSHISMLCSVFPY
jgi:hypothetical protein